MNKFNPDKLSVEYRRGVYPSGPIISRKYTLTHSDITGELFLTIAPDCAFDKINLNRDEVLGEWNEESGNYIFNAQVLVDGSYGPIRAGMRNRIFIEELPLALEAIHYGDRSFFQAHPLLNNSPIYVYFKSSYPVYNRTEYWGTFSDYYI